MFINDLIIDKSLMKNIVHKMLAVAALAIIAVPSLALATTGEGSREFFGRGKVTAWGMGNVEFGGNGLAEFRGDGTFTVNSGAHVVITGEGQRIESDAGVTYEGFKGVAKVRGHNVTASLNGNVRYFTASGKGYVKTDGQGTVMAKKWTPMPKKTETKNVQPVTNLQPMKR